MGNFDHYAYGNNVRGAGEVCRRQGIAFLPMVVESFGGWHEVAEREVRKLGPVTLTKRKARQLRTSGGD